MADGLMFYSNNEGVKTEKAAGDAYGAVHVQIDGFRVKNYKSFHDSGWVSFAPIMILYGNNSAGKTAINQILIHIREAYLREQREQTTDGLWELERGDAVYDDIRNSAYPNEKIQICFRFKDDKQKEIIYTICYGRHIDDSAVFLSVDNSEYELNLYYRIENVFFLQKKDADPVPSSIRNYVEGVMAELRRLAGSFSYIRPFREEPQREYVFNGGGSNVYERLYSTIKNDRVDNTDINDWVSSFGYDLRWRSLGNNRGRFELINRRTGSVSNLIDNGYGVGQSLPVIINLALLTGQIILIDSPEAFLQTARQSEMADQIINSCKRGNMILMESSSEYILMRIRRRIAEHGIDSDSVRIYYIDNDKDARCVPIELFEDGELSKKIPSFNSFFSASFDDLCALMTGN